MWKLNIEDDQTNVTTVNLARDEYTIGRDVANSVRLTERNISRKHAILKRNDDGWVIRDLGSYNGCSVNGKRVTEQAPLAHGDLLQLGDYRLELVDEDTARTDILSKTATAPGRPFSQTVRELPDRLVMVIGPAVGVPFPLMQKRIIIGRGEECDLPINDTSVSRVHAEIRVVDTGRYEIVDLGSSNGVRVNGAELKRALLDAGDVIELGDVQLKFVPAGQMFNPDDTHVARARRHSLEPGVGDHLAAVRSNTGKIVAIVVSAAVIAIIGIVATRAVTSNDERFGATEPPAQANPAAQRLEEAKALLARGDIEGALRKSQEIPDDSNLRESAAFKDIQAKWAEAIFQKAAAETDATQKRALLDRIAKSPDVGSVQRKRAVNELAMLQKDTVEVSDLPSARTEKPPQPEPTATHKARKPAVTSVRTISTATNTTAATAKPTTTTTKQPTAKPEESGGLVRDTPY